MNHPVYFDSFNGGASGATALSRRSSSLFSCPYLRQSPGAGRARHGSVWSWSCAPRTPTPFGADDHLENVGKLGPLQVINGQVQLHRRTTGKSLAVPSPVVAELRGRTGIRAWWPVRGDPAYGGADRQLGGSTGGPFPAILFQTMGWPYIFEGGQRSARRLSGQADIPGHRLQLPLHCQRGGIGKQYLELNDLSYDVTGRLHRKKRTSGPVTAPFLLGKAAAYIELASSWSLSLRPRPRNCCCASRFTKVCTHFDAPAACPGLCQRLQKRSRTFYGSQGGYFIACYLIFDIVGDL